MAPKASSLLNAEGLFLIAEVGQAHDGSLGIAHSYIDALAKTGVDAVKFQVHIADAESSPYEKFRVPFSYRDKTRSGYWKRMEFSKNEWAALKRHCATAGLEFIASPFSMAAVRLLESIGARKYKIPSGEVANHLMLERIARTGKPVLLSSGMSPYAELDDAVRLLRRRAVPLAVFQCTTAYPTRPEEIGLNVIPEMQARYRVPIGLSDHSGTIFPGLAAVAMGAQLLEVHAVFDRRMFGPDSRASLTIPEIAQLAAGARFIRRALRRPVDKNAVARFAGLRRMFTKSLALGRALKAGRRVRFEDLETKKPGDKGIPARDFREVVGRKLRRDLRQNQFLNRRDLLPS